MASDVDAIRRGFDDFAEVFDRTRPVCPPALFDDLLTVAGLQPGIRVLEIGCGTGQATLPLAERGVHITAVELGAQLAARARQRLDRFPFVEVVTSTFEEWQPDRRPFAAVAAFNALHWVAPDVRYSKPAAILTPGGALVVAGCHWAQPADAEPFWREVQTDYQAVGYPGIPPPLPEEILPWHLPLEALAYFDEVLARCYPPYQVVYAAEDYLGMLASQSGTRALAPERRREFLERVRARLRASPRLTATFVGYLTVGRRKAATTVR
ncbi:MAG TPA: class I SAM-dependent methyltransferase [Ktedonobacterales bacterium]|nr:class I SAM-dependent methyltransferase [Ktedonobacterales bacterium]